MSRLDEYFAKANRGSQTTSSVSASGEKPASKMDAYFAKAGKPVRTNPLNLYTEALKASQGQSTMQTPYADAAAQTKQSGTQNLYAQAAENAKKSGNAAKGTSVVFNSVYGKADDRASSAGSGKYADILKASDYTALSKSGESKRKLFGDARYDYINNIGNFRAQSDVQQAQGRGQDYGKYAFMTDDEIGVYNYLYATQGKKAANAYLSDLEPELDKQWYTGTNRATTEALGKNAATRTLASAMTVAAQPARTITSMIAMADDAVRTAKGQEINPYSKWRQASNITQDLRADTSQHIEKANPGMGGKVGSFVYNTAMSAADSAMNALVAKGIGEAVGLTGDTLMKATNILGSALMSSEAASLSIAESKEKGYSNAGALALGLTRGAIEYASEAVGGEWVIRKIKANPLSFVKSMALTMIPEGMEEVMSDAANGVVNLAIDAAFGTEESGIPKMLEYYRTSGTDWQKKHAELATVLAVLGQEGLSFLGGALATLGSSSVQYSTNRANINQTAERLDTTPKNVVQMMQDAQTENPSVIYALAELTDAENADDLRQKIGTKEDMKRAAEYLTQQMEAGGRYGAQEGTYTAGAQNAPVGAQRAQNEGISTTPAAAINIQEGMNNGQSTYQGRENGSYDLRTGGQAAAEGGTQALAGGRAEIPGGVGADAQEDLRQVTPAQLGIRNGGTEAVTVVDARQLGGDAARAYNLLAANNIEPVAVRGAIQVNNGYANAYTESGKVFFRVDAVDSRGNAISPEALVRHELFHNYISEEVLQASDEVIRESMTAEEYDAMYESYRDAYASIYDFENMSEDEIERLLTEEIAADAYAGLNWFSGDAPVQEAVRAETERNAPARRAEAQQETTGPPGRTMVEVARESGNIQRNNIEYSDEAARNAAQKALHDRMVSEGKTLDLTENREAASQYFPNLRSMPKAERTAILRERIQTLKNDLRTYLNQLKGVNFEFEINGNTIEATVYNAGVKEVLQNLTQDKAGMLSASEEIFRNAEYLYSTQDKTGSPNVTGWDYFYVPVKIGGDTVGVRIAIRNMAFPTESQIYNWGIKREDTSLDGVGLMPGGRTSADVSSDVSSTATIRQTEGNSQEKSSGKASVEVENRDSDNKKQRRKKLSEAEKYQNTTPKMAETRAVRNVAEYEKQISGMEKRLETGGQATLNEGGGNFYRVNIREENGEYYAYISDGKNVVAKHKSKAKMEAIRWAGDRMRAEIASRILYNPDTKLRGSYQSDLKRAENREYPVFKTESGTEVQTVPFWTWVQGKNGHYGLVVGKGINGAVRAWFPAYDNVAYVTNATTYAVEGDYENRTWNNEIVAEALDDAEESAAARNARKDKMRESQENDRRETERLRARENLGAGQRFVPNKSSGEVYRELMGKGKSEVKVQMTGFLKGTPRDSTFKIEVKPTPIGGYFEATIFHDGHKADTLVRALKETAARDAAEEVITMANKNFSEENYQRAKKFEAEKTADEDARIAELFGEPEQLDSTEPSQKSGDAAETENTAAGTTIGATTEKVTSEVIKAERNYREDFEKITSGAMRMFVNAGDTVRRIAKATGSKSLEGYYFNAGAYSQRAGNWIAKGGARTDTDGHRIGASLADTLAPMRKDATKYRDFQLYLLHMHNVDRMKYDNSGELERIKENLRWVKEKYPELRELSNEELRRIANSDSDSPVVRQAAHEIYLAAHNGEAPSLTSVAAGAAYALELERQRAIVEKQGLKPVFGYDVTADDSQTAAQLLEAKNPEFKEWAKEVYKYSDDLIRYRVEAGLITPEFANALKKRYPHYIPTFREEGTNSKRARSARRNGGIVVSNVIGRAVGSDGVLLPLHTALSRKTVSTMRNAGLNQFGLALVREYDRNTKAAEKYIWNVAESEYTPTEAAIESDEDYKPVFENVFSVKEKGKVYDITMDEGLAQALNAFQPDKYANSDIAKLLKKGNDLFKALCTGYNPIFMVRNLVRDAQDAAFYSTDSATWAKMFPSAWKQIVTNGEIWQQYKALGGSYASMLDYTTGMVKEPKSAVGKLAAKYESLGQAIEAAPRLAEFMTILANKGGSKTADGVKTGKFTQSDLMEAMLGAADITTNFARGGTVTKMLNKYLVPFLNPSVQGADKFVRNITDRKGFKAWASLAIKAAALGILPELLNGLLYRDDDEWDDIPDQTKSNYYLFKLGDGYWMKIPRGRALAVFSAGATYAQEKAKGNDPKFSDVIEVVKSNVAPTDIFNQNIATAWTQTKLFNPDNPGTTWYGGNIESDRLQNYRPGERYDEKTDELSKWIGKTFNLSPKKINYLLDQYSGVVGDLLLPWFTPSATASSPALAPLKQAFMLDSTSTNKTTGEYYDLLDELKYDANDGDIGAGITRKYVSHAGDEVNDYYQQIRAIQSDENLTKAEKNRLVRALKSQLIERQKEIIAQAEPYREAVSDYLKAHPELSTDNDAAIAEYAELYGITEDQAESRMDAIVYREANREVFGAEYALRTYNADVYDKARAAYAKGVSYDTYYDYYFATKEMHADKDENGKSISGSKKAKVVEYINSLDIPPEQKDALYVAAGYTAKSARNQKWNGGSGGSGGRRGRGKRTALKAPTPKAPEIIIPRPGTASSAKAGGTSKTPKVSGNVIADFTKTASGTDIQKAVTQAKRKALKAGNRTVYVEEGSPIDYFLKYGKLPSLK